MPTSDKDKSSDETLRFILLAKNESPESTESAEAAWPTNWNISAAPVGVNKISYFPGLLCYGFIDDFA